MSQKRDLLSDIVSQKRDLLSDCQWGGRTDGHTDGVTMRGEGLSCYVQLKIMNVSYKSPDSLTPHYCPVGMAI